MQNFGLILLVFAFVCCFIAGVAGPGVWPPRHLGWIGVTFWIAAELLGGVAKIFH